MVVPLVVGGTTDVMARLTLSFRTMRTSADLAESPPIPRQCLRFVGEFVVSPAFERLRLISDKSLIRLARPA